MRKPWKTIRIFISSTFRDMHAERDHLVKYVFPQLREWLLPYRIHLVDVDLRWGVTKEQADNDEVLDLCLDEIDRSRPFFIGLLGERYGWVPTRYPVKRESKLGWVQTHVGKSVTELEILYGVLDNPAMRGHAFFYFRNPSCLRDVPKPLRSEVYEEIAAAPRMALRALKEAIRRSGHPLLESYPARWDPMAHDRARGETGRLVGLEAFGEAVRSQLWEAIRAEHGLPDHAPAHIEDALTEERDHHDRFVESRLRVYVPRPALQEELLRHLDSEAAKPLLVTGAAGSGKSAALAWLCEAARERFDLLVSHFVGASANSTSIRQSLRRWCAELKTACEFDEEVPEDYPSLVAAFGNWISRVPPCRRLLLVVDAVNQFDETDNPHVLAWLPRELPAHVQMVVSCMTGDAERGRGGETLRNLEGRTAARVRVEALTDGERIEILCAVPSISAKTLSVEQIDLFMANAETRNPLYLLVALEELRGSALFETVDAQIRALPQGEEAVAELFVQMIHRMERDFDSGVVRTVFSALACSRSGVAERDLEELAGGPEVYPVLRQLRPYLQARGEKLDFFHRQLPKAVRRRYLPADNHPKTWHRRLAEHLERKGSDYRPTLEELVWQQVRAEEWDGAARVLTDPEYLEAKVAAGLVFDLARDFREVWQTMPEGHSWRLNLRLLDQSLRRHLSFIARHTRDYPQALFQCLWNEAWWYDTPEAARYCEPAAGEWGATGPPWADGRPKLSGLLQRWRGLKEIQQPGFVWLRMCRPPALSIGGGEEACIQGHDAAVTAIAVSPDGRTLVSGSMDKTVRLWDLASGVELACLRGHEQGVSSIAIFPAGDRLVSCGWDGTVRVWAIPSGDSLACLKSEAKDYRSVSCSGDGKWLTAGAGNGSVYLWDTEGYALAGILVGHKKYVEAVAFSPDSRRLASASSDGTVRIWDVDSRRTARVLEGHATSATCVAWSPDGRQLASGDLGGKIRLWDSLRGVLRIAKDPAEKAGNWNNNVTSVAFSPDSRLLASGSADHTVRLWDAERGSELIGFHGHEIEVQEVAFTPDGRHVISASGSLDPALHGAFDHTIRVWDTAWRAVPARAKGHRSKLNELHFSTDGQELVTAGYDYTVRVWDANRWAETQLARWEGGGHPHAALSPDGTMVAFAVGSHTEVWTTQAWKRLSTMPGDKSWDWVNAVVFLADGHHLATSVAKQVVVWDIQTGTKLFALGDHGNTVQCLVVSENGLHGASCSMSGDLYLWDMVRGIRRYALQKGYYCCLAFSPDGQELAAGSGKGTVHLWNVGDGSLRISLVGHEKRVQSVAYTRDGRFVVSSSLEDETVRIWDRGAGHCVRCLAGTAHAEDIASSAEALPWHCLRLGHEIEIENADQFKRFAWLSEALDLLRRHPAGRIWAGARGAHLVAFSLEGTPGGPPPLPVRSSRRSSRRGQSPEKDERTVKPARPKTMAFAALILMAIGLGWVVYALLR